MFYATDARRACRRGVIGSTMGANPRGTSSNPVEGNGHFFPTYRQLYLSQTRGFAGPYGKNRQVLI